MDCGNCNLDDIIGRLSESQKVKLVDKLVDVLKKPDDTLDTHNVAY
jgi:hypothetical protein